MNYSPKVSIVILNWNGQKYLEQFLPSVLAGNYTNYEVIVADNGSVDNSVSFLEKKFPGIRLIRFTENYGFAKGYNEALKQVQSDYYCLLNSDVEVPPGWLQPMVELLEKDKTIAACQPKLLSYHNKKMFEYAGASGGFVDKYGYPFCRGRIFNTLEEDKNQYNNSTEVFWATGACMFVRANAFWEVGGFDGDYFAHMEEIDLCWRLKNIGHKIYVEPKSIVYHVGGATLQQGNPI